jgi:uncharacterized membrane-anchored protein
MTRTRGQDVVSLILATLLLLGASGCVAFWVRFVAERGLGAPAFVLLAFVVPVAGILAFIGFETWRAHVHWWRHYR